MGCDRRARPLGTGVSGSRAGGFPRRSHAQAEARLGSPRTPAGEQAGEGVPGQRAGTGRPGVGSVAKSGCFSPLRLAKSKLCA